MKRSGMIQRARQKMNEHANEETSNQPGLAGVTTTEALKFRKAATTENQLQLLPIQRSEISELTEAHGITTDLEDNFSRMLVAAHALIRILWAILSSSWVLRSNGNDKKAHLKNAGDFGVHCTASCFLQLYFLPRIIRGWIARATASSWRGLTKGFTETQIHTNQRTFIDDFTNPDLKELHAMVIS